MAIATRLWQLGLFDEAAQWFCRAMRFQEASDNGLGALATAIIAQHLMPEDRVVRSESQRIRAKHDPLWRP